jgi:rubrerythrin
MKLDSATTILDEVKFVKSHQDRVRSDSNERNKAPFAKRLIKYAMRKKIHLCTNCYEVLGDDIWKCPQCGVNSGH